MNFDINHIAFDLEALAKSETGVITSISCIVFNFKEDKDLSYDEILNKTFYAKLNIPDQIQRFNRTHDKETLTWWKSQPPIAQELSIKQSPNDIQIDTAFAAIRKYLNKNDYNFKKSYVWTRGNSYDIPKLQDTIRVLNEGNNNFTKNYNDDTTNNERNMINTFMARDIRTFSDIVGDSEMGKIELSKDLMPSSFIEHHAQHDIALDVYKMLLMYKDVY